MVLKLGLFVHSHNLKTIKLIFEKYKIESFLFFLENVVESQSEMFKVYCLPSTFFSLIRSCDS